MTKKKTKQTEAESKDMNKTIQEPKQEKDLAQVIPENPSDKWESKRLHDRQPVKGIFRFHEVPGGTLKFSYLKYKGDPVESFELKDGQTYTLPLGVAKHLRSSGYYPVHSFQMDETGKASKRVGQRVKRYTFEPSEFIADPELNNPYSNKDKEVVTVSSL